MKMKKRLFAILLALCVTFTMMPLTGSGGVAHAEDGTAAAMQPTRTTMLDLTSENGKYIATDGKEKTVNFNITSVTDSAEGWSWNHETKTLTLAGARIVVTKPVLTSIGYGGGYYYGVLLPGDVTVVLTEGTENIIQAGDAAGVTTEGIVIGSVGMGDARNLQTSVTICGSGKLTIKGGKPAKDGNESGRISAGIFFGDVIVKDSAKLEIYGDSAENIKAAAYSRGISCSQMTITDNAQVTAKGGNVKAVRSRESSGISASQSLIINGRASLKAYGGDVTKNQGKSNEWSTSMGICAAGFEASENASVEAYGGKTYGDMAGSSMGVYIHKIHQEDSEAKLSDNAFLYAEGGQAGGSSFGIYGDRDPRQQSHLTIKDNAYMKAVGKENGGEGADRSNGISTYGMTINGGTVIASAETKNEGSSSIAAISLLTQPPLPTYKEGLNPVVKAGTTETDAVEIESPNENTYTNRWVKIQTSQPNYAITATPSEINFGTAQTGYAQPAPKTVTITNTGNETVELSDVVLPKNSNYIIVSQLSGKKLAPRETAEFTVQPQDGLGVGNYDETLTISGSDGAKATVKLTFSVSRNDESGSGGSGSSGGGSYIPVQKPAILSGEGFHTTLSADGTKLTITAADGYEITDVMLNGTSKGSVTQLSGLKTGDKVEIKTAKKEDNPPSDDVSLSAVKRKVARMQSYARSSKTPNQNIKLVLKLDEKTTASIEALQKLGYTIKYKFYRSTKKSSGYKASIVKKTGTYINTSGKKGVRYYYKMRIMVYDKNGKLVAQTELKQCKYACRVK